MNEYDRDCSSTKKRTQRRMKLKQQIQQQINQDTADIDRMLQNIQKFKRVAKLVSQCHKYQIEQEDEERSKNLIWKYDQKYNYQFEPYLIEPYYLTNDEQLMAIAIESRNNWIQQYLDNQKVKLYGRIGNNKILILGQHNQRIDYKIVINGRQPSNGQSNLSKNKHQEIVYEISMKQFYAHNKIIGVQFSNNKYLYSFANSIVKLNLHDSQQNIIIIQAKSKIGRESDSLRRILVFRLQQTQQEQQILLSSRNYKKYEYRVISGFFDSKDFIEPLKLQAGQYAFMPFPGTSLNIYTQKQQQFGVVPEHQRLQIKQLNLMLQGFPQCHPQNMKAEFVRECDLKKGIVIEIYRNIYENQICFKDVHNYPQPEDIALMFQSLYSRRYQSYRLRKGQVIVQFYQVTKKPAVLYQPQKKVLVDRDQDYQAKTIHSILK